MVDIVRADRPRRPRRSLDRGIADRGRGGSGIPRTTPAELFVQDMRRKRRYARTPICARLALAYAGSSAIVLFAAVTMSGSRVLLPLTAGALLALIQFALDLRQRDRSFAAEICGTCATAMSAAAIAVASHRSWEVALTLALLAVSLTLPAILFVRAILRHERQTTTMVLHGAGVIGAAILWQRGLTPAVAIAVMAMLLLRAAIGLQAKATPAAKIIGIREAVAGGAAVLIIAAGYIA
jgi:hypothetical protein